MHSSLVESRLALSPATSHSARDSRHQRDTRVSRVPVCPSVAGACAGCSCASETSKLSSQLPHCPLTHRPHRLSASSRQQVEGRTRSPQAHAERDSATEELWQDDRCSDERPRTVELRSKSTCNCAISNHSVSFIRRMSSRVRWISAHSIVLIRFFCSQSPLLFLRDEREECPPSLLPLRCPWR